MKNSPDAAAPAKAEARLCARLGLTAEQSVAFIAALRSGKYATRHTAVAMAKYIGDCRLRRLQEGPLLHPRPLLLLGIRRAQLRPPPEEKPRSLRGSRRQDHAALRALPRRPPEG